MRIVEPYARLLPPPGCTPETLFTKEHGEELLRRVEWCGRISHRAEDKQTSDSYENFLRRWVMEHGDFSIIEHCVINADLMVDRGLSHELVRHRIAAYTQESTRFVNYSKKGTGIGVIFPMELDALNKIIPFDYALQSYVESRENRGATVTQLSREFTATIPLAMDDWEDLVDWYLSWLIGASTGEREYLYQIDKLKKPPELARDMLPHCTATRMIATHNLRGWRHLMIMRTSIETHRKLRPLMGAILDELQRTVPVLFEDLEYGCKQSNNLKRAR